MAAIYELVETLHSRFPGAPEPLLVNMWLQTAREFFKYTRAWTAPVSATATNSDFSEYELSLEDPIEGAELFDLVTRSLIVGTTSDVPVVSAAKFSRFVYGESVSRRSDDYVATFKYPKTLDIYPTPSMDLSSSIRARGCLQPSLDAEVIDDDVVSLFKETIENGACVKLLTLPRQPWMENDAYGRNPAHALIPLYQSAYIEERENIKARAADNLISGVRRRASYGGY